MEERLRESLNIIHFHLEISIFHNRSLIFIWKSHFHKELVTFIGKSLFFTKNHEFVSRNASVIVHPSMVSLALALALDVILALPSKRGASEASN